MDTESFIIFSRLKLYSPFHTTYKPLFLDSSIPRFLDSSIPRFPRFQKQNDTFLPSTVDDVPSKTPEAEAPSYNPPFIILLWFASLQKAVPSV